MQINQSIQFSKYFSYKNEIKKKYISQFQFLSDFDKKKNASTSAELNIVLKKWLCVKMFGLWYL